jgi:uncharacterized protein involved in exopolysaccharide biosynthesis
MNQLRTVDFSFLLERAALKRGAIIAFAFALVGFAYATLAPKWYEATLTVMPARQQKAGFSGISSMLAGDLGAAAAGLDGALGGAEVTRIAAVLQGRAVADAVIDKFDLKTRYGYPFREGTRKALWAHCGVKALPKPGLVELTCEDKDPRFAHELVSFFADYGNQVFRRVGVGSATEEVRFLEKHVAELRHAADESSARMLEFEQQHQIVDLDTQSKAVVSALATLNSQRISKQLELDYAMLFSAGDEASLRQLRSQLSVIDAKVRDLETVNDGVPKRTAGKRDSKGMFPAALSVPQLRAEYEKLYRDRKVSEATLVFALERLEMARANEARDVSTFVVLDPPTMPERHVWPKRLPFLVLGGVVGLFAAACLEAWRYRRRPPRTVASDAGAVAA